MAYVTVIHAKDGKIDSNNDEDDDNGIIAINDAPLPAAQDPLVLSDLSGDEPNDDEHDSVDNSDDDDDDDPSFADAVAKQDDSGDDEDQGVLRRSNRKNRGTNRKYNNYNLMMRGRREARGGQRRATIRD